MADPLSLAASIIAVVELTGTVLGYLYSVKGSSKERETIINQATSTLGLLNGLKFRLESADTKDEWFVAARALAVENGPLDQYKAALELLQARLASAGGIRKTKDVLTWHFTKSEVERILLKIERLKSLVQIALEMDHFKLSQAIHSKVSSIGDEIRSVKADSSRVVDHVDNVQSQAILDWLSTDHYAKQQNDCMERRQSETGQWFLDAPEFKQWKEESPLTLYCPGHPGSGKTIMAATVIDHLRRTTDEPIIYLYCNYKRRAEQSALQLMKTLLRQLIVHVGNVPSLVRNLHQQSLRKHIEPSDNDIANALDVVLVDIKEVVLVIDALDECAPHERPKLLTFINSLRTTHSLRVLATSRYLPDVLRGLHPELTLEIRAAEDDVKAFLSGHLDELSSCVRRSVELQELIVATIVKAVDGMFLLAQLHLDSLKDKRAAKLVRTAVERLPSGSDAYDVAYEEAMMRIHSQPKGDVELATLTLSWLLKSKRPLCAQELQHALAIEPGLPWLDPDNLVDVDEILAVCGGLVIADRQTDIVRLVHYTTQQYLERHQHRWTPHADSILAIACASYISFEIFPPIAADTNDALNILINFQDALFLEDNPLLRYSANHLGSHVRDVEIRGHLEADLETSIISLLECQGSFDIVNVADLAGTRAIYTQTPIHYAAYFDLKFAMKHLLACGVEPDKRDSRKMTPLAVAAYQGSDNVMNLLLQTTKCDPNSKDKHSRTPLHHAVRRDRTTAVDVLLRLESCDVDAQDHRGVTALCNAASKGHSATFSRLLAAGANVEHQTHEKLTPLLYAVKRGHIEIVELIFKMNKVNLNHQDCEGLTALSMAALFGHFHIVQSLLSIDSADAIRAGVYRVPAEGARVVGVEIKTKSAALDEAGQSLRTSPPSASEDGKACSLTPLHIDADHKDLSGRTPLSYAAEHGRTDIVLLLLSTQKVDPDSQDQKGVTPLNWAVAKNNGAVAQLLLDTGKANVNLQERRGFSPAHTVAYHGHREIVGILLATRKVHLGLVDEDGLTPIKVAESRGHSDIVELLKDAAQTSRDHSNAEIVPLVGPRTEDDGLTTRERLYID